MIDYGAQARIFFLSAAIAAFACVAGFAADVVCRFRENPVVNDTVIRLGHVAGISGADDSLSVWLSALPLGEAAPPGFSRLVSFQHIQQALAGMRAPISIRCTGENMVTVKTFGVTKTVGDFEDTIVRFLRAAISWDQRYVAISLENASRSFALFDMPYSLRIAALAPSLEKARGAVHLHIDIEQGGRRYRIPAVCKITVKMPVIVTTRPIEKGERCTPENAAIKIMDITNYKYACYTNFDSLASKITVRTLGSGAIIHEKHLRPIPLIEKGQEIVLIIVQGAIRVSIAGRARESGVLGQKIWVQNLHNQEILRGIVSAKNEVTIRTDKGDV